MRAATLNLRVAEYGWRMDFRHVSRNVAWMQRSVIREFGATESQ
jgi:hypothetical protein